MANRKKSGKGKKRKSRDPNEALPPVQRRNFAAKADVMRKGGAHETSRSAERQQDKQKLKKQMRKIEAGLSGLDCFLVA